MAIYTASYFEPSHQHGKLITISHCIPKGFKVLKQLNFLTPTSELLQDWQRGQLDQASYILEMLTPQCREVIRLRFGLEDENKLSFAEIGARLNLSRERVRHLEHKAISQLREDSEVLPLSRIAAPDLRAEALPLETI